MINYNYQLKKSSSKTDFSSLNKVRSKRAIYWIQNSHYYNNGCQFLQKHHNFCVSNRKSPVYLLRMKSLIVERPYGVYIQTVLKGLILFHVAAGRGRQTAANYPSCILWQKMNGSVFTIVCFQAINDLAVANMAQKYGEPNEINFLIMQIFPQGFTNKMQVKYAFKLKKIQLLFVIIQVRSTLVWRTIGFIFP